MDERRRRPKKRNVRRVEETDDGFVEHYGPDQPSPAESSVAQPSPAQPSADQSSADQPSADQPSTEQPAAARSRVEPAREPDREPVHEYPAKRVVRFESAANTQRQAPAPAAAPAARERPRRRPLDDRAPIRPTPPLFMAVLLVLDCLVLGLTLVSSMLTFNILAMMYALVCLLLDVGCFLMQGWAIAVRIATLVLSFGFCAVVFIFTPRELLAEIGMVGQFMLLILMSWAAWSLLMIVGCAQAYGPAASAGRSRRRRRR